MHELSIAQNIIDIVEQYVPRDQMSEVRSVRLKLGSLSGIVPESLDFCFSAMVQSTDLGRANLEIERVPTKAECSSCGASFFIDGPAFACSGCGNTKIHVVSGTELQLVEIELAGKTEGL